MTDDGEQPVDPGLSADAADSPAPGPEEAAPAVAGLEQEERQALLTALLFTGGEVLAAERLEAHFALDAAALELLVEETSAALRPLGLDILKAAGGYRLVTAAQWDPFLRDFYRQVRKAKLSRNALEILAVIAYEQPVTRTRVDELRQSSSESSIRTLLERRLVTVAGRDEGPGRPFRYRTTDAFLELFGLESLADLPPRPASFDVQAVAGFGVAEEGEDEDDGAGREELDS
jgi:segregation and condensation protein B